MGADDSSSDSPAIFVDDDEAYLKWLEATPHGFVLNCYRKATSDYLILHRASCETIRGRPARGDTWTCGDFSKVCAEETAHLNRWSLAKTGGLAKACGICRP